MSSVAFGRPVVADGDRSAHGGVADGVADRFARDAEVERGPLDRPQRGSEMNRFGKCHEWDSLGRGYGRNLPPRGGRRASGRWELAGSPAVK
jgi:hypothetical protein